MGLLINSLPVTNYAYLNLLYKNSHICKFQKNCKVCKKKDVLKCIHQYFVPNKCNFTLKLNTWIDIIIKFCGYQNVRSTSK